MNATILCVMLALSLTACASSTQSESTAGANVEDDSSGDDVAGDPSGSSDAQPDEGEVAAAGDPTEGDSAAGATADDVMADDANGFGMVEGERPAGSLPRDVIQGVIRSHLAEARFCYERELVNDGNLAGRVMVRFIIDRDGHVSSATHESDAGMATVGNCVAARVRDWTFPAPQGRGVVAVNYPFNFTTRDGAANAADGPAPADGQ